MHDLNETELASVVGGGDTTNNTANSLGYGGEVSNSGGLVLGQNNYQYGYAGSSVSTTKTTYNGWWWW